MHTFTQKAFRRFLGVLPLSARRHAIFIRSHHRLANFRSPKTFSEKINWRILYDRREALKWTCDKIEMKKVVTHLDPHITPVPTLWSGADVSELNSISWPERWVLKPNHLSGDVMLGEGRPSLEKLAARAEAWLGDTYRHSVLGEWAYAFAAPQLLLEPWIGGMTIDDTPTDYKIFVFDGEPRLIQVHTGRATNHRQYHFDTNWLPINVATALSGDELLPRPPELPEMLRQAALIGADFDFMRIDFYAVDGLVYFGETTPYPAGGRRRFSPRSFDRALGELWTLPRLPARSSGTGT